MRKRLMLLRYDLKKVLWYNPLTKYQELRGLLWATVAAYHRERSWLSHYKSSVASVLASVGQAEKLLIVHLLHLFKTAVVNYPSNRRRWLSETWHMQDYSTRPSSRSTAEPLDDFLLDP